ncbi:hypothetical protein HJC10_34340 [Corallococcus exiguus]|uniref:hypothetical protein n=1 Tax=Corallococcus exiguus TaxID=83462 RepID=UPI00147093E0|nr:hypothetical protein [Corallococcus exiguus]NNB99160.1 hypothetical protein [Corallococcus exiguus]NNC07905.1 hypothetical protein [Corallococcus exiguus]
MLAVVVGLFLAGCGGGDDPGEDNTPPVTCSAANCTGCCFNNTCQTGNTASACGKAGAACKACNAAQVCKTEQTCGADPAGVWFVQPTSAQITASNNGTAWDADGSAPDVFVEMQCPGATVTSVTPEVESYTPAWTSGGCTGTAGRLLAEPWAFRVWDSDVSVNDTITGVLLYQFREEDFTAGRVTLQPSGGMTSITLTVRKQP